MFFSFRKTKSRFIVLGPKTTHKMNFIKFGKSDHDHLFILIWIHAVEVPLKASFGTTLLSYLIFQGGAQVWEGGRMEGQSDSRGNSWFVLYGSGTATVQQ